MNDAQQQQPGGKLVKPAVIVVSSFVADGSVGGRIVSFALERLGFPVWFVPTVTLPRHPGRGPSVREEASDALLEGCLADLVALAKQQPVAAVLTGYIGHASQAEIIAKAIAELKKSHPDLLHLCDPVLGDHFLDQRAGLYVAEETAHALKEHLWAHCDIATPNAFELNWLCGITPELKQTPDMLRQLAAEATPSTIAVTSVPGLMSNHIGNMLVRYDEPTLLFEHLAMPHAPHGTGDLFSALFLGQFLSSKNYEAAIARASASLFEMTARSAKAGLHDLPLIAEQSTLERPMAIVAKRIIGSAIATSGKTGAGKRTVFKPSAL